MGASSIGEAKVQVGEEFANVEAGSVASKGSVVNQVVASAFGGCLVTLLLNPITILKVHLQRSDKGAGAGLTEGGISPNLRNRKGSDLFAIASNIVKKRGIKGFWAGTPLGLAQTVPSVVLYFTSFEQFKEIMYRDSAPGTMLHAVTPGLAGGLARTLCVTAVAPIELMRTVQTSGIGLSTGQLVRNIYKRQGILGFYRGWKNTVLRDTPFSFLYWLGYDLLKKQAQRSSLFSGLPTPAKDFGSGAIAAVFAAICTHPFDVLKTNQQVNIVTGTKPKADTATIAARPAVASNCTSTTELFMKGGLPVMFRGLSMRLVTIVPGSAIMVTVYETMKKWR